MPADDQLAGDVLGVVALQHQREHLLLAPRQLMGIGIDHKRVMLDRPQSVRSRPLRPHRHADDGHTRAGYG